MASRGVDHARGETLPAPTSKGELMPDSDQATSNLLEGVSVVILARNEEACLGPIIEGAKGVSDEVVVVDGHSTDRTVEIAREFNAKIIDRP